MQTKQEERGVRQEDKAPLLSSSRTQLGHTRARFPSYFTRNLSLSHTHTPTHALKKHRLQTRHYFDITSLKVPPPQTKALS